MNATIKPQATTRRRKKPMMISVHLRVDPALLRALDEVAAREFPYTTKMGGARMQAIRKACTEYVARAEPLQTSAILSAGAAAPADAQAAR